MRLTTTAEVIAMRPSPVDEGMCAVALMACVLIVVVRPATGARAHIEGADRNDLIFVTDDTFASYSGCDAISVIDGRSGDPIFRGDNHFSPGRLATTSDGGLVLSLYNNFNRQIVGLRRELVDGGQWHDFTVRTEWAERGGAVAISPNDEVVLVVDSRHAVRKYFLRDIGYATLGPLSGVFSDADPAEIVFSPDSATAYVIGIDGQVFQLDVATMTAGGPPIPSQKVALSDARQRLRNTFASISPDGRYLVTNTLRDGVNVIDLSTGRHAFVQTPGVLRTHDLEFNYERTETALLAISGLSVVVVYEFDGQAPLRMVSSVSIPPQRMPEVPYYTVEDARLGTLAWTGAGDGIVAAIGGAKEFRVLDLVAGQPTVLRHRLDFDACVWKEPRWYGMALDVVTLNRPRPSPTPMVIVTASATPHEAPRTPTAPPTSTMTARPTATSTSPPTATATQIRAPAPLFLPLLLRELCDPDHKRADVALVIDTSSSMAGAKLEDAKAAAAAFVAHMDLSPGRDQVAVVRYDREADVVCQLSRAQAVIEAAIRGLAVRNWTHIDKGLRAALAELQGPRHLERNLPVIVLLTDGVQTGTPGGELRAAEEVRAAGVRLYAIGLGGDVDAVALREMAGDGSRYHFTPDSADLARIYAEIASDILCPAPAGGFWPGR